MKTFVILSCSCLCLALGEGLDAQESPSIEERSDSVSPDKQWEYKCAEYSVYHQCEPEIVKAGTSQLVLDLGEEVEVYDPEANQARVIWAPDSKRFAFNYSPVHAHHTRYKVVVFYQLRGDKWVALRPLVGDTSDRAQLVKLAKEYWPKNADQRRIWRSGAVNDVVKLHSWADANTAVVYVSADWDELSEAFLFTIKFNADGNWKIVKTHHMSEKERKELEDKELQD